MKNVEFISYRAYPSDPYLLGVATLRVTVVLDDMGQTDIHRMRTTKLVIRYKHVQKKDGSGTFFVPASHNVNDNGEKKYLDGAICDSSTDEAELRDFLRDRVKMTAAPSALAAPPSANKVTPMYGTATQGAAQDEQLPF